MHEKLEIFDHHPGKFKIFISKFSKLKYFGENFDNLLQCSQNIQEKVRNFLKFKYFYKTLNPFWQFFKEIQKICFKFPYNVCKKNWKYLIIITGNSKYLSEILQIEIFSWKIFNNYSRIFKKSSNIIKNWIYFQKFPEKLLDIFV